MSYNRPRNKFEMYFIAIGNILYYVCFFGAIIFILGYALYQLLRGNFIWFYENGFADIVILLILGIGFGIFYTNKREK